MMMDGVRRRCRGGAEPRKGITLFAFDDYFPAVATTDILSRVTVSLSPTSFPVP